MDRRLLAAIGLMLIVAILPSLLWPPKRPADRRTGGPADTVQPADRRTGGPADSVEPGGERLPTAVEEPPPAGPPARPSADTTPERRVIVESDLYRYEFSTRGARLVAATLLEYRSFAAGADTSAQLLPAPADFLTYRFVTGRDTLDLAAWIFEPDAELVRVGPEGASLNWVGRSGAREVRLTQRFQADGYLFEVAGSVSGSPEGYVLVGLGPRLRSIDGDTVGDIRSYGVVTKARRTERLDFRSLDPGERREIPGPFEWVAIKSRYFVAAVMALESGEPQFGGALAVGGPRPGRAQTDVAVVTSLPAPRGEFRHSVYLGPQEYRRLKHIGHDFEDVNPYGWVFRPIIRPFANFIVLILLWMHETLRIGYGWVLILFGILVRVILWPLNQKAMRSATAMQVIQPEVKAIQEKYGGRKDIKDQQRMQQEMMALYKEHGVNPLGGCLPMLIPMPVLFALFFVFANTIEFRGVSFLWLPDLSRPDPIYIIPLLMGASMFLLSWIGQRGLPPNPQTKMMMYIMPGIFTFMFLNFSSGLNLYYAVSNIASLPQQWLISQERRRRLGERRQGKG
ncbi:MAG TPA: membrane protein insertase YidC [Gemmatimonadales bacterium]|nr:membrane protein insertase YidC [Gemmatimonadales bacterium]